MCGLRSKLDGVLGNVFLGPARPAGKLLNRLTIPIACFEIHLGIDAGWILPQEPLDAAEIFEEPSPIQQGEMSQAGERIADRYQIFSLAVLLTQVDLTQGFPEYALEPTSHRHERGFVVIEIVDQLQTEKGARTGLRFGQFGQDRKDREKLVGVSPIGRNKPVCPEVGNLTFAQLLFGPFRPDSAMLSINAMRSIWGKAQSSPIDKVLTD